MLQHGNHAHARFRKKLIDKTGNEYSNFHGFGFRAQN
jgi:hypothetical protein